MTCFVHFDLVLYDRRWANSTSRTNTSRPAPTSRYTTLSFFKIHKSRECHKFWKRDLFPSETLIQVYSGVRGLQLTMSYNTGPTPNLQTSLGFVKHLIFLGTFSPLLLPLLRRVSTQQLGGTYLRAPGCHLHRPQQRYKLPSGKIREHLTSESGVVRLTNPAPHLVQKAVSH